MLKSRIQGKAAVFMDEANLFYTQKMLGWRISYKKLMDYLKEECGKDVKVYVFTACNEDNKRERKFVDMLQINGYIVRSRPIETKTRKRIKGNVDTELAFEMARVIDQYDTAIVMSGDGDFVTPVQRLKNAGKKVIVISSENRKL